MSSRPLLYTLLPWNFITKYHEGVVVQKDGLLQRSFAYRAPDLDSSGEVEINALCVRVDDLTRRLGAGWAFFVEAQRFYTQDYPVEEPGHADGFDGLAGYLIDREREASFSAAGKHFESSYFITFTWKPPVEGIKKLTSLFMQTSDDSEGSKSMKENVQFFVNETDAVIGLLSSNMLIAPLTNEQTVRYLHASISFNRHPIHFPHTQISLDRILPDMELVNSFPMKLGDYYIPIIGVNDFPEETYPDILESLNRTRMEYRWVTRYLCLGKEDAKKEAQKKEKSHRGSRETFLQAFTKNISKDGASGSGVINHGADVKAGDAIAAGVEIEIEIAALGYLTSCVMVWDKDPLKAKKKAEQVRTIINSAGFTCKEERFNSLESFVSMMPGQVYANYRALPVMSYTFSHVIPLSSVWAGLRVNVHAGHISGVSLPHVTCSTGEGTPFYLNLNPASDVGHTAIWGPTGAGKSTLLNLLEAQFFKYPSSQVIVLDKGRSCRQICLASGGLFYEPASDNSFGVAFQPLRDLETEQDMLNAIDFIEACCEVNLYTVTPPMRAAIKGCLEQLRDKDKKDRTITSFTMYVSYLDPETRKPLFNEILGDYLWHGGKYGKIFDSEVSGITLDTRFLAIEMEYLMNQGQGCIVPALVYLFNLVEKKFDGRLSLLVLDEAWLFLKNETFSQKIAEWLKVLRKKNVFVVFATQDVADVEQSPLKTTIIQQCLTKIYLADPSALTPGMMSVYRAFGLTDPEIELIANSQMKRDYFYTSPIGRRMFQLDLGPLTLGLIGTPHHELLDSLAAEKGLGVPLCRDILEKKRIAYKPYIGRNAPRELPPPAEIRRPTPPSPPSSGIPALPQAAAACSPSDILDAVSTIKDRCQKGKGRAAEILARRLGVSSSIIYLARKLLRHGDPALIEQVKKGELTFKKACKSLDKHLVIEERELGEAV
jgi:type IV secretion system protein VirB4